MFKLLIRDQEDGGLVCICSNFAYVDGTELIVHEVDESSWWAIDYGSLAEHALRDLYIYDCLDTTLDGRTARSSTNESDEEA